MECKIFNIEDIKLKLKVKLLLLASDSSGKIAENILKYVAENFHFGSIDPQDVYQSLNNLVHQLGVNIDNTKLTSINTELKKLWDTKYPNTNTTNLPESEKDANMAGNPVMLTSFESYLDDYPTLQTYIDGSVSLNLNANSLVDWENKTLVVRNYDLNKVIASIKNKYFKDLVAYANYLGGNFSDTLYDDSGQVSSVNEDNFNAVLQFLKEEITPDTVKHLQVKVDSVGTSELHAIELRGFTAFLLFLGNNFDRKLAHNLKGRISISHIYGRFPNIKSNKYTISIEKKRSATFGDVSLTDAKSKVGSVAKALIEGTPIISFTDGKVILGELLTYDKFAGTLNKLLGKELFLKLGKLDLSLVTGLNDNAVTNLTRLLLRILGKELDTKFNLDSSDLDVLKSIYERFYNLNNEQSLASILLKHDRLNPGIVQFDLLLDLTHTFIRSNDVEYLIYKDGKPQLIQKGANLGVRLNLEDRILSNINTNLANTDVIKNQYNIILDKGTVSFDLSHLGKTYTFIFNPNSNTSEKFTIKALNDNKEVQEYSGDELKNLIKTLWKEPAFNKLHSYYILQNQTVTFSTEELFYIKLVEALQSMLPGINFFGKDFLTLVYFKNALSNENTKDVYLRSSLFKLAYSGAKAIALRYNYTHLDSEDGPKPSFLEFINSLDDSNLYNLRTYLYFDEASDSWKIVQNNSSLNNLSDMIDLAKAMQAAKGTVYKNVNDSFGNKLPTTRNFTVARNLKYFASKLRTPDSPLRNSILAYGDNIDLVSEPVLHQDVTNQFGETKAVPDLTEGEMDYVEIVGHYMNSISDPEQTHLLIKNTIYADKTTISVFPVSINKLYNPLTGKLIDFRKVPIEDIYNLYKHSAGNYYSHQLENVLASYRRIFTDSWTQNFLDSWISNNNFKETNPSLYLKLSTIFSKYQTYLNSKENYLSNNVPEIQTINSKIQDNLENINNPYFSGDKEALIVENNVLQERINSMQFSETLDSDDINTILSLTTWNLLHTLASIVNEDLVEELHYNKSKTLIGKAVIDGVTLDITLKTLTLNPLLRYKGEVLYKNEGKFKSKLRRELRNFIHSLLDHGLDFPVYDFKGNSDTVIYKTLKTVLGEGKMLDWIDDASGSMIIAKDDSGNIIDSIEALEQSKEFTLNPILDRYFGTQLLLSFELRATASGTELVHPAKRLGRDDDPDVLMDLEEAARELSQLKREVIHNVPMMPIAQNDLRTMPPKMRCSVMMDMPAPVYTVNGNKTSIDSLDGGDNMNPLSAILFNKGLQSVSVGEDIKCILHDLNNTFGNNVLFKYAAFSLYNSRIRRSVGGTVNMLDLFRRLTDFPWDRVIDDIDTPPKNLGEYEVNLSKNIRGGVLNLAHVLNGSTLYYLQGSTIYKVDNIIKTKNPKEYIVKRTIVDYLGRKVEEANYTTTINSIWELYNVLGSCYSGHFDGQSFVFDDSSLYATVGYMNSVGKAYNSDGTHIERSSKIYLTQENTWQPLKRKFIASAINLSAVKMGATNVNDVSVWSDGNKTLSYMKVNTSGWGVVLDYDHIVTDGKSTLTEITLVISAIIAGGKMYETVKQVYEALGQLSLDSVVEYTQAITYFIEGQKDPKRKSRLYELVGQYIIDDLKDTNSAQNAFQRELKKEFKNFDRKGKINHIDDDFKLDINDPTIFYKYVTIVGSAINRIGIKRPYNGLGAIMVPAYNVSMLHHRIEYAADGTARTYQMTYDDVFKEALDVSVEGNLYLIYLGNGKYKSVANIQEDGRFIPNELATPSEIMRAVLRSIEKGGSITYEANNPNMIGIANILNAIGGLILTNELVATITLQNPLTNQDIANSYLSAIDLDNQLHKHDISQLLPEDSVMLITQDGTVEGPIVIDNIDTYTRIKNNPDYVGFYYSTKQAKNLQPCKVTFIHNGNKTSLYDIPIIQEVFKQKDQGNKSNKLDEAIDYVLNQLSLGYMITSNYQLWLDSNVTADPITDLEVGEYECILPKLFKVQFGLKEGDSVYDILKQGVKYFSDRYSEFHKPRINNYDVCYTRPNGLHRYAVFGRKPGESKRIVIDDDYIKTQEDKRYRINDDGDLMYPIQIAIRDAEGNIKRDESDNIIWEDYIIPTIIDGEEVLWCKDSQAVVELYNSQEFDSVIINPAPIAAHTDNIKKVVGLLQGNRVILDVDLSQDLIAVQQQVANNFKPGSHHFVEVFNSFKKSLELLVARIPSLTLQSFMKMKVVAFSDTDKNTIQVSHYQTYLQGSDYDIDKAYAIAFEMSKAGKFIGWSPFFKMISSSYFKRSLTIPLPTMKKTIISKLGIDITQDLLTILSKLDANPLYNIHNISLHEDVVNLIKKVGRNDVLVDFKQIDQTTAQKLITDILDSHNLYFKNVHKKQIIDGLPNQKHVLAACRNFVTQGVMNVSSDIVNLAASQTPVSMGEAGKAAENSTLGKDSAKITSWDPASRSTMTRIFMDGKDGIGIAANGEKVFFNLLYYTTDKIIKGEDLHDLFFSHKFKFRGVEQFRTCIANINLNSIKSINPESLANRKEQIKNIIVRIANGANWEDTVSLVELSLGFSKDQSLIISALLSAATDNAKELILGKINASPDFMNIYLYGIMIGIPFVDLADFMTSDNINTLIKLHRDNMFADYRNPTKMYQFFEEIEEGPKASNYKGVKYVANKILNSKNIKSSLKNLYKDPATDIDTILDTESIDSVTNNKVYKRSLHKFKQRFKLLHALYHNPNFAEDYNQFKFMYAGGLEMTAAAAYLKANLGFEVTLDSKISLLQSLERTINIMISNVPRTSNGKEQNSIKKSIQDRITLNYANIGVTNNGDYIRNLIEEASEEGLFTGGFDIIKFLNPKNERYRNLCIEIVGGAKHTFNLLRMLVTLPHFNSLYTIRYYNHEADAAMTKKYEKIYELKKKISLKSWDKSLYRNLAGALDDVHIAQWIQEQGAITFTIKPGLYFIQNGEMVLAEEEFIVSLGGNQSLNFMDSLATFKYWMESVVVPNLLLGKIDGVINPKLLNNPFITHLELGKELNSFTGSRDTGLTLPIDFRNMDRDPLGYDRKLFNLVSRGFKNLKDISLEGTSLLDWFFMYSLYTYKNQEGFNRISYMFTRTTGLEGLFKKYYQEGGEAAYTLLPFAQDAEFEDLLIQSSPVVSPVMAEDSGSPYVRVKNQNRPGYSLYRKSRGESEYTETLDIDEEFTQKHVYVPGYVFVKNLENKIENDFYKLNIKNYHKVQSELKLSTAFDKDELLKRINNLIYKNVINLSIKC